MTDLAVLKRYLNDLLLEKEGLDEAEAQFQSALILQILDKIDEIEENIQLEEDMLYG